MKSRISKILIANRGEIACRIIKTAKKMGIKTVSVYSEVDKNAVNVSMSDEAYCIGPAPSRESYLCQNKILEVAKRSGCQAVHPGYGFLSENAEFSQLCEENGVIFIGPPASAIRIMGIKSASKNVMMAAQVPVIPGYHGEGQSDDKLAEEADLVGFPLMIKAIHGGGGKGMRIVTNKSQFLNQLQSARRESKSAFGDDSVLLERFVCDPRHIEVQVFADHCGNCVYLYERDCSVQRRHQKVMEEAPAPGVSEDMRKEIGCTAVRAAKAVNYVGAGTVEFIFDSIKREFFFMEMNTRLQVEHPVTEFITNTDLVEWQIKVASGEELPLTQEEISLNGHAVEARIYAENPYEGFFPRAGILKFLSAPKSEWDTRVETGVRQGDEISVHYDPMIAKLVVWGENRSQAFSKLKNRLESYNIAGVETNVDFLMKLCQHPEFMAGNADTGFIEKYKDSLLIRNRPDNRTIAQAVLGLLLVEEEEKRKAAYAFDPWVAFSGFRVNHLYTRVVKFRHQNDEYTALVTYEKNGFRIRIDEKDYSITGKLNGNALEAHFEENISKGTLFKDEDTLHLFTPEGSFQFEIHRTKMEETRAEGEVGTSVAPMPGIVDKILVNVGDDVVIGTPVMVIIAMKMEHVVKSGEEGTVEEILYRPGQSVAKNAVVFKVKPKEMKM